MMDLIPPCLLRISIIIEMQQHEGKWLKIGFTFAQHAYNYEEQVKIGADAVLLLSLNDVQSAVALLYTYVPILYPYIPMYMQRGAI